MKYFQELFQRFCSAKGFVSRQVFVALFVASLVVTSAVLRGVSADDDDSDGLENEVDNNPEVSIQAPVITTPKHKQSLTPDENDDLALAGFGEVGTDVRIFRSQAGSSSQVCSASVDGNGVLFDTVTADYSVDSTELLEGNVVDQVFYDITLDADSSWATDVTKTWQNDTPADTGENVCDYQVGDGDGDPRTGADTRCGLPRFPEKAVVAANTTGVFIFDYFDRSFWKRFDQTNITSVAVSEGRVAIGTSTVGAKVYDFQNDDLTITYTTSTTPALGSDTVNDVALKKAGDNVYLAIATDAAIELVNLTTNTSFSKTLSGVNTLTITPENRLLYTSTSGAATFISDAAISAIAADDWAHTALTSQVNISSATVSDTEKHFVGHDQGTSQTYVVSSENLVRTITKDYATLPLGGTVHGHWSESVTDRSGSGNNLTNNGTTTIEAVASGAELQQFTFDGSDDYLSSTDADFNVTGTALSVGVWVKRPDTGGLGEYQKLLIKGTSVSTRTYFLSEGDEFFDYPVEQDAYFFGVRTDQGEKAVSVQTTPVANTWEFIVGTYDGSTVKIYRNGELEQSLAHTGNVASVSEEFRIGYGYGSQFFDGNMALPFVAAHTFSQAQIQQMYEQSRYWFGSSRKITLQGTSNTVADVSCDGNENYCYVATADGVTKIAVATGLTEESLTTDNITTIAGSGFAPWQCTVTEGIPNGDQVIFGRSYIGNNASDIQSPNREFKVSGILDPGIITLNGTVQATGGAIIEGASITFTGSGGSQYLATSSATGAYTLSVPTNFDYTLLATADGYQSLARTVAVGAIDQVFDIRLEVTQVVEAPPPPASGKAKTVNVAGQTREEKQAAATMTYEESLAQVTERNQGVSGQILTYEREDGSVAFYGYRSGRLAAEDFDTTNRSNLVIRYRGKESDGEFLASGGFLFSSAKLDSCPKEQDVVARFRDVGPANDAYKDVVRTYALGLMGPDQSGNFNPHDPVSWVDFYRMALAGECLEVETAAELRKSNLPQIPNLPIIKEEGNRVIYTALKHGLVDLKQINFSISPTREQALKTLLILFPAEINLASKNSSFTDIRKTNPLAPLLIAAKKSGWFDATIAKKKRFAPKESITRLQWASWFSRAFEDYRSELGSVDLESRVHGVLRALRQESPTEEKEDAQQARRIGPRLPDTMSDAERHLLGRHYRQFVKKQAYHSGVARQQKDIRARLSERKRAPLTFKDNSENIRRAAEAKTARSLRQLAEAQARNNEKKRLEVQEYQPTSARVPQGVRRKIH